MGVGDENIWRTLYKRFLRTLAYSAVTNKPKSTPKYSLDIKNLTVHIISKSPWLMASLTKTLIKEIFFANRV